MKKFFVSTLIVAGILTHTPVYADGSTSSSNAWSGTINGGTHVSNVFTDGSTGTLSQIGQLAAGSVPTSTANASNGYAKLDASARVTSPVVGDTSSALVTALSHNVPAIGATLPQLMADDGYIHSLGASTVDSNGVISSSQLKTIINTATRPMNLHISSGESMLANQSSTIALPSSQYNRVMVTADGELLGSWDEDHTGADWLGGNLSKQIGEGVLVEDFEPRWGIMRDREYNDSSIYDYATYRAPAGISADFYTKNVQWTLPSQCDSTSNPAYNGYWCDIGDWKTSVHYDSINTSSNAGTNGRLMDFISTGQGHWKSDDVGDWIRMQLKGTNWGWAEIREMVEPTGIAIGGYTDSTGTAQFPGFQRFIYEWDMAGVGPDKETSYYNPLLSNRKAVWMTAYNAGGWTWTASTAVPQFQILLVDDSVSGKTYMYENTVDGATSGKTQPTFTFNETTPVADGTASWIFLGVKKYQIGCMLCVGGKDGDEFGALIGSNAVYYNSPIDLSTVVYDTAINSVMRTEENSFFDLSANGTKAGQNNHLLGYSSASNTLEYLSGGSDIVDIDNAGTVSLGGVRSMNKNTLSSIQNSGGAESKKMWCHDCRSPGQAVGAGTGRWIYKDSANTWRTEDGVVAAN